MSNFDIETIKRRMCKAIVILFGDKEALTCQRVTETALRDVPDTILEVWINMVIFHLNNTSHDIGYVGLIDEISDLKRDLLAMEG